MGSLLVILGNLVSLAASLYTFVLLARVIFDWARVLAPQWYPAGWLLAIIDVIYKLTDPPDRWLRKFIPPIRLGTVAIDVGFMVLFIGVILLQRVGGWIAYLGYVNS